MTEHASVVRWGWPLPLTPSNPVNTAITGEHTNTQSTVSTVARKKLKPSQENTRSFCRRIRKLRI